MTYIATATTIKIKNGLGLTIDADSVFLHLHEMEGASYGRISIRPSDIDRLAEVLAALRAGEIKGFCLNKKGEVETTHDVREFVSQK